MATLTSNRYGKAQVRLSKITRNEHEHLFEEITVRALLSGDFNDTYTKGDNSPVLPTDTIKNTVYALAKTHDLNAPEAFALTLANHYIDRVPAADTAEVNIDQRIWQRMTFDGSTHAIAFTGDKSEKRTASVTKQRDADVNVTGGISDLPILKTTDSAFVGFLKDEYTVLPEERDRIMATKLTATWTYNSADVTEFNESYAAIREALLKTFANHDSESLQHTLFAMGEAALAACPHISKIYMVMPNVHNFPFDLGRFGMENNNEIFFPADEPHGYIDGTVAR